MENRNAKPKNLKSGKSYLSNETKFVKIGQTLIFDPFWPTWPTLTHWGGAAGRLEDALGPLIAALALDSSQGKFRIDSVARLRI